MESNLSSFAKNSLSIFGTRIILIIISIVSSIIVTRILGPSNRGVMEMLLLVPSLIVNFGNLGIGNANLYFVGKKQFSIDQVSSNSLSLSMLLGFVLILVGYGVFHLYADTLFKDIPKIYVHITLLTIPFLLYQKFVQYMLLGKEQIGTRNIIVLVPAVANFVLIICFVEIMRLDLWGVILCSLVVNLLAAMLCFYFISKNRR